MKQSGFEDLEVWKRGCALSIKIYRLFTHCRDYGFRDQICRAGVSVPANIAEGYERNSSREFIRFLNISKGSAGELRTHIYLARELGYLDEQHSKELIDESRELSAMLSGLIKSRKKSLSLCTSALKEG
jgi:four helix bundle protein